MQIIAGYIIYGEQAQPGVFGSPKSEARFDFAVEIGENYETIANQAANEAKRYVRRMIGLEKPGSAASASSLPPATQASVAAATPAPSPEPAIQSPPGTKEAAAIVMNAADSAVKSEPKRRGPKIKEPAKEPATNLDPVEAAMQAKPAVMVSAADPLEAAKPKPITNADLNHEISAKCASDSTKLDAVRALRNRYVAGISKGTPMTADIPEDKRRAFLDELAAL